MIAVDTNILVYAHRKDSAWHQPSARLVATLAEGAGEWGIPWPCIHEFHAIVTHPRIYAPPSTVAQSVAQVDAWMASPGLRLFSERAGHWESLRGLIAQGRIVGARVHDARIAALCQLHGVKELWSADRDFTHFPSLNVRNPLVQ